MQNFIKNLPLPEKIILSSTIIGLIIAFFAWISPFGINKKSLSYSINQNIELIARDNISKDDSLELKYNNEKIYNLVSTKIRIKNTGNQPIAEADFIEGLNIIFPSNVKIVNYKVTQVQFIETDSSLFLKKKSENQLRFSPVLINPEEIFELNIIITIEEDQQGLKSLEEYLKKENKGLFGFFGDNSKIGQDIKYNQEEIKITYKIYGVTKLNKVSEIMSNSERKSNAGSNILLIFIVFFMFAFTILIQIFEKPQEKTKPGEITTIEEINNQKSRMRQKMIKIIIILFIVMVLINLKNIYIYLFLQV